MQLVVLLLAIIFQVSTGSNDDEVGPEFLDMLRAEGRDEEFAKLMKIPDPSLVRPSKERSDELMKFGGQPVSELGDILLTEEQKEQGRQGIIFSRYGGSKWRNHVIPYTISKSDFSYSQRRFIENSLQRLNASMTNLKLRKYSSSDEDYVMVFSGRGCYSNLGRIGGKQSISLQSNGCLSRGTIQHEFIHAAGFLHEHMRPDRDDYIKILPQNIPADWQPQYEKVDPSEFGTQGKYDYYSVMHYPITAPETGRPAFEVLDKTVNQQYIGQRDGPTAEDIRNLDELYA